LGLRTFLRTRARYPLRRIYWLFDTFSYKSYLLLPRNFRTFWPRRDRPTPPRERALIDHLATAKYGAAWRADAGIVARSGAKRLRAEAAPIDARHDGDTDVQFFAAANPDHAAGDMRVCLCPLTAANWWALTARALDRVRRPRD
jgi:hypothetical protein